MSGNFLSGINSIIMGVVKIQYLILLDISNCNLEDNSIFLIVNALQQGWTLISLNVSHNPIHSSAFSKLFQVLRNNTTLTELYLSDTKIDSKIDRDLLDYLKEATIAASLDMSHNLIGDKCTKVFGEVLPKIYSLIHLQLNSCRFTDHCGVAIINIKALQLNNSLKTLQMRDNFFSENFGIQGLEALNLNQSITHLDLHSNNVDRITLNCCDEICSRNRKGEENQKLSYLRNNDVHLSIQISKIPYLRQ
jgi:Ran GTPase-activating protein (RanGAP) involved in mRNA processing and transport